MLYLTLNALGWLLAAASAVLWLRKYPGRPIGRRHPETQPNRPLTILGLAGLVPGAYGGTGVQNRYHWNWWAVAPAVYVPLLLIETAAPILVRRWQLQRSPSGRAGGG